MSAQAAHILDRVLPEVPIRQWVLSVPFDLRFLLATQPQILTALLRIFVRSIFSHYKSDEGSAQCGAIAFIQRFDSALNLNVHFHVVVLDGGYLDREHNAPLFRPAPPPTNKDLLRVSTRVAIETQGLLTRHGFIDASGEWLEGDDPPTLPNAEPFSFGWLTSDGRQIHAPRTLHTKDQSTASVHGFSVHAGLHIPADDRERIERLCRYVARPPFANDQLSVCENKQIAFKLSKPRRNGASHAFMTPQKFMRRICSLIAPAKQNLVRYFGVLGAAAKLRPLIVPAQTLDLGIENAEMLPALPRSRSLGIDWASLLKRVYDMDVFVCPCGGQMRVISVIEDPKVIRRSLNHLHLPNEAPRIHSARAPPQLEFFDDGFE